VKKRARHAKKKPVFGPHPDDAAEAREAFAAAKRGEFLTPEESAKVLSDWAGESFAEPKK
jgi:hypothetical protein